MMGFLLYGTNSYAVEIEDRALAHLKIAILSLLRAQQSVAFSYTRSKDAGSGRETLWISPSTDMRFQFFGNRAPNINEPWVRAMIESASAPTGMQLVSEPEPALVGERIVG